jgi:hypothetical protein
MKHDIWKQLQAKLSSEQAILAEKVDQRRAYDTYKMHLANEGVGTYCFMIMMEMCMHSMRLLYLSIS